MDIESRNIKFGQVGNEGSFRAQWNPLWIPLYENMPSQFKHNLLLQPHTWINHAATQVTI